MAESDAVEKQPEKQEMVGSDLHVELRVSALKAYVARRIPRCSERVKLDKSRRGTPMKMIIRSLERIIGSLRGLKMRPIT